MMEDVLGTLIRVGIFVGIVLIVIYIIIRIIIKSTTDDIEIKKTRISKLDHFCNGLSTGAALMILIFMYALFVNGYIY